MSAIEVLKQDHRRVEQPFGQYQEAAASPERKREVLPDGDELAQESLQEHQQVKQVLSDLDGMSPDDPGFDQRVGQLIEDFQHHAEEEEDETFPKLQGVLDEASLADVGRELEEAKKRVPTRPHPTAPDEPPGIKVAGPRRGPPGQAPRQAQGPILKASTTRHVMLGPGLRTLPAGVAGLDITLMAPRGGSQVAPRFPSGQRHRGEGGGRSAAPGWAGGGPRREPGPPVPATSREGHQGDRHLHPLEGPVSRSPVPTTSTAVCYPRRAAMARTRSWSRRQ